MTQAQRSGSAHGSRVDVPVTLLLSRRLLRGDFWSLPQWRLEGVVIGEHLAHRPSPDRPVRKAADAAHGAGASASTYAYTGYRVTLHRDAAERYWHALIGEQPRVYVVCREPPDTRPGDGDALAALRPLLVTVDYDEAQAFAETDQQVLSAPIPGELYRMMEEFVLRHYKPKAFVKRKRRSWGRVANSERQGGAGQ